MSNAAACQNVHLSGTDVLMTSTNQARFEANNIEMSTAWNGDVKINTAGGYPLEFGIFCPKSDSSDLNIKEEIVNYLSVCNLL